MNQAIFEVDRNVRMNAAVLGIDQVAIDQPVSFSLDRPWFRGCCRHDFKSQPVMVLTCRSRADFSIPRALGADVEAEIPLSLILPSLTAWPSSRLSSAKDCVRL